MNPEQLWETTMNPEQRKLYKVQIEDAAKAERRVSTLMGDKVDPRKRWIVENVDFGTFCNMTHCHHMFTVCFHEISFGPKLRFTIPVFKVFFCHKTWPKNFANNLR
jgi:hypothetical protein